MNSTYPSDIKPSHTPKQFLKFDNDFSNSFELEGEPDWKKDSDVETKINFNFKFVNKKNHLTKTKNSLKLFIAIYCFPNAIASFFYLIICQIDSLIPCEENSWQITLYKQIIKCFFELSFYPLLGYKLFFPIIIKKAKVESNFKYQKMFAFTFMIIIIIIFQYLVFLGLFSNYLLMHATIFIFSNLWTYIICKRNQIKFNEIKKYYMVFAGFLLSLLFHHYFVKWELIIMLVENEIHRKNENLFKLAIFFYFNIFRWFTNLLLLRYFKLCTLENKENNNYGIIMFLKYLLSDIICSVMVPLTIQSSNEFSILFNLLIFTYQLFIIYARKNFLFEFAIFFFHYVFDIKKKIDQDEELEKKCLNLISDTLNELMIVIYLKIILMSIYKKFMSKTIFIKRFSDTCLTFNSKMKIDIKFLVFMLVINALILISVYFSRKKTSDRYGLFILNKNLGIFERSYQILLNFSYVELYFQFYFYLNITTQNENDDY